MFYHFCTHTRVRFLHRSIAEFFHNADGPVNSMKHQIISTLQVTSSLIRAQEGIINGKMMFLGVLYNDGQLGTMDSGYLDKHPWTPFKNLVDLIQRIEEEQGADAARIEFSKCNKAIIRSVQHARDSAIEIGRGSPLCSSSFTLLPLAVRPEDFFLGMMIRFYRRKWTWLCDYFTPDLAASIPNLLWTPRLSLYQELDIPLTIRICHTLLQLGASPSLTTQFSWLGTRNIYEHKQSFWESFLRLLRHLSLERAQELGPQDKGHIIELAKNFISSGAAANALLNDTIQAISKRWFDYWRWYIQITALKVIEDFCNAREVNGDDLMERMRASGAKIGTLINKIEKEDTTEYTTFCSSMDVISETQQNMLLPYLERLEYIDCGFRELSRANENERQETEKLLIKSTEQIWQKNEGHHKDNETTVEYVKIEE